MQGRGPGVNPPLTIAEKMISFLILKQTEFFCAELAKIAIMFFPFGPTLYFNLEKLSLRCDMQQYRRSNFSDVFCLNCIFVIGAAAEKQLVSTSFLKWGVSAVAMAAHKLFFLNQIESFLYSFHYTRCSTEAW